MLLSKLIESLPEKHVSGAGNPDITKIAYDSRRVTPGSLFACIKGGKFNGHDYIGDSLKNGAGAILVDDMDSASKFETDVPLVVVPDTRAALPILSNHLYDFPSRKLKMVGVTGTKGKTTTTHLVEGILAAAGYCTGLIGTLGARFGDEELPPGRTTPESVDLQELLARMVDSGVSAVTMEVSSHALVIGRTDGCEYDAGIFTNLTHDHLDFHNTMDEYLQAKITLFSEYPQKSGKRFTGVINADDPRADEVKRAVRGDVLTYGLKNTADIRAVNMSAGAGGVEFDVESPRGVFHASLKLGGIFNVYNALAAMGAGLALGIDPGQIKAGLESVNPVPGRFVSVDCGQDFGVVVDYAHSPDSLENVLRAARELTSQRLIVVFGCGGDRDRKKRPVMGQIGAEMADVCIITSDNPRTEEPEAIIDEILAGADEGRANVERITDRRQAIDRAIRQAGRGDVVVIAGKGHETYQIFRDETIHFDDSEVVREVLADLGYGCG